MDRTRYLVIKVGSQLVVDEGLTALTSIAHQINHLKQSGYYPILVSSGAVALGLKSLNRQPNRLFSRARDKFLAAAVGQHEVISRWNQFLDYPLGQVLVDKDHLGERTNFVHTLRLVEKMCAADILPIINENDALNHSRRTLGNNDLLAAHICNMLGAQCLALFTQVGGIYRDFPTNSELLTELKVDDPLVTRIISQQPSTNGTGGMYSKLEAANMVARNGSVTFIIGPDQSLIKALENKSVLATRVIASRPKLKGHKLWLSETSNSCGVILIDSGAAKAMISGNSSLLLPGVRAVSGTFDEGKVVDIYEVGDPNRVGKGVSRWSSDKLRQQLSRKEIHRQSMAGEENSVNRGLVVVHRNQFATELSLEQ